VRGKHGKLDPLLTAINCVNLKILISRTDESKARKLSFLLRKFLPAITLDSLSKHLRWWQLSYAYLDPDLEPRTYNPPSSDFQHLFLSPLRVHLGLVWWKINAMPQWARQIGGSGGFTSCCNSTLTYLGPSQVYYGKVAFVHSNTKGKVDT